MSVRIDCALQRGNESDTSFIATEHGLGLPRSREPELAELPKASWMDEYWRKIVRGTRYYYREKVKVADEALLLDVTIV